MRLMYSVHIVQYSKHFVSLVVISGFANIDLKSEKFPWNLPSDRLETVTVV